MTEFEIKQKIKSVLERNPNANADQFLASFTSRERSEVIDFLENAGLAQKLVFDNLQSMNSRILEGTKIKTLNLPKVKKISSFGSSEVREIFIGSSLKYLDQNAFMHLPDLKKVTFSEGIKRIPAACFKNLSNLKEVYLPESVQYIGGSAFEGCSPDLKIITPGRKPGSIFKCSEKDLEFLKSHIVFEEPIVSESLTEAFSNSMPEWLKDALLKDSSLKRIFTRNNIDLNKCRFEDRDVSTIKKRKDPIITDSRYIQVWSVSYTDSTPERILVLPFMLYCSFGVGTAEQAQLACKYTPLKTYLEYARHFCYIDTLDSSIPDLQNKKQKRFNNRKDPEKDRFTQKERPLSKLDKSGYVIPSIRGLKNRLISKYGGTLIYKKLEKCYEDLQELRDKIIDANNMILSDDIRYMQSGYRSPIDHLQNAMNSFRRALDIYRDIVDQLEESNNLGMNFSSRDRVLDNISTCLSNIKKANDEISDYNFTSLI